MSLLNERANAFSCLGLRRFYVFFREVVVADALDGAAPKPARIVVDVQLERGGDQDEG